MTATESVSQDAVTEIEGIGSVYASRLAEAGIETIPELATADVAELADRTGLSVRPLRRWQVSACERLGMDPPEPPPSLVPAEPSEETKTEEEEGEPGLGAKLWEGTKTVLMWTFVAFIGLIVLAVIVAIGAYMLLFVVFIGWMFWSFFT